MRLLVSSFRPAALAAVAAGGGGFARADNLAALAPNRGEIFGDRCHGVVLPGCLPALGVIREAPLTRSRARRRLFPNDARLPSTLVQVLLRLVSSARRQLPERGTCSVQFGEETSRACARPKPDKVNPHVL